MSSHVLLLPTLLSLLAAFALVGMNAFFVAAEFSIVKVRRTRLEELQGQGVPSAKLSIFLVDKLDEYLSATQLGITIVSLGLGWIGEKAFADLISLIFPRAFPTGGASQHVLASALAFGVITLLHIVLGELVPKSLAIQDAERITLRIARPLRVFYLCTRPLICLFTRLAAGVSQWLGYRDREEAPLTEDELKLVMKESREDGVITDSEAQIITRAFEFADKRVSDIMIPMSRVEYLSLARPLEQNLATIRRNMRTRFPLCKGDFSTVVGVVHMKDAWPALLAEFSNRAFEKTARPVIFVEPSVREDALLRTFQARRAHLAIVKDPRTQSNVGIVTFEDVMENLVGDIRDEHGN